MICIPSKTRNISVMAPIGYLTYNNATTCMGPSAGQPPSCAGPAITINPNSQMYSNKSVSNPNPPAAKVNITELPHLGCVFGFQSPLRGTHWNANWKMQEK